MTPDIDDLSRFEVTLSRSGLFEALQYLNGRTPFRFTGVYRFDGDTLRNVALVDRWTPESRHGSDAAMVETFCAIVKQSGDALQVLVAAGVDPRIFAGEDAV